MSDLTPDLCALEKKIGYTFKNKDLLVRALTLSSASEKNNQTMECFGDAILEYIVTEKLFYECSSEKDMTVKRKIAVCDESLTQISRKIGIDECLIRGKGDIRNKKAVPSAYECIVCAIYMDGGMDKAKEFVFRTIDFNAKTEPSKDFKSKLQELMQCYGYPIPVYTHKDVGDIHKPEFVAYVTVCGQTFTGRGLSVKAAEKEAAEKALENIKI